MADSVYSLRSALLTTLTRTSRPNVPVMVALRNTLAVALPLGVGLASGHPVAGLGISAGALNVMFADQPGPYRQRLEVIALVTLAATLSGLTGFLVGGHPGLLLAAMALWGFAGGLLVLFGPHMTRVGMTSMILLVVATSTPLPWQQALQAAGLILAGGVLQASFSIAAWPLRRYLPERQALAAVYRDLAQLARQQSPDTDAPPVTDSLTELQHTLLGHSHARGRAMEAFYALMELAERIRLELMAWQTPFAGMQVQGTRARQVARVLDGIAMALERAEPPARANHALERLQKTLADATQPARLQTLAGQLAAAVRNTQWAGSKGEIQARHIDIRLPRALRNVAPVAALRANLSLSSIAFRHALRCAVALTLAMAVAHYAHLEHGYWLPMTAAIVLRPDFGSTLNFGLLRVLGTILGLILTTALLYLSPDSAWAHLVLMTVLCFAFRYLAGAHYGVAVAALTGTVVILLAFEGVTPGVSVNARVLNTALGSGLALLAYIVWPTWEHGRARPALAAMLDAYANYLHALAADDNTDARRDARASARVARSNAQASLDRLRAEPATTAALMELANSLFANGNRLIRTAMTLEAMGDAKGQLPCQAQIRPFLDTAVQSLRDIATALRDQTGLPALPPLRNMQRQLAGQLSAADAETAAALLHVSDRLTDNIDTLEHMLRRPRISEDAGPSAPARV
ncbi:MAG TPA: FUSC family protein [Rhodanobacteraceae bacterium]|nr:FUSC family protein [Rhodanobacteraceae bacterium]